MLDVTLLPILDDNYTYIIRAGDQVGLVDVGDAAPVLEYLEDHNLTPNVIFTTHHHWDHINGNQDIMDKYDVKLIAPEKDKHRIPNISKGVNDGDTFNFGDETVHVIETPGHTSNHIVFWFESSNILFSADTLFAMGCGRLFEGTPKEMFQSFEKLRALPDETIIYCGHEYSLSNGEFALTIEPENQDIIDTMQKFKTLRKSNHPTIPTTMAQEKKTNIFMRAENSETFQKYRDLKDKF